MQEVAAADQTLGRAVAGETLQVVSTGTDMCVIDLRQVRGVSRALWCHTNARVNRWKSLICHETDRFNLHVAAMVHTQDRKNKSTLIVHPQVSSAVAAAAEDTDLVILEGMGRAIETNLNAKFSVDALRLGMIKHLAVAAELGGRLYDIVCKFDPAP